MENDGSKNQFAPIQREIREMVRSTLADDFRTFLHQTS